MVGPTPTVRPPAVPAGVGPPWTRRNWYVLSGLLAVVVVVLGLLLALSSNASATVQSTPAPTTSSFTVTSGDGKAFLCDLSVSVGGRQDTIQSIDGDRITLTDPLSSSPSSGTTLSQRLLLPTSATACGAVASSPAPTTTQISLAGGAGEDFGPSNARIGGAAVTVASVDPNSYRLTLSRALDAPPSAGTEVSQSIFTVGSLIGDVVALPVNIPGVIILAIGAVLMRPFAARITKKGRTRVLETLLFGVLIWLVDTFVWVLEGGSLNSTSGTQVVLEWLLAAVSGFILAPAAYPSLTRLFRPRPRPAR